MFAERGQSEDAIETTAEGTVRTVTVVAAAADVHPFTVTVTAYVPDAETEAVGMVGFCCVEAKPFGPVHS